LAGTPAGRSGVPDGRRESSAVRVPSILDSDLMRRIALMVVLSALALAKSASAEEKWAVLGHELGCWNLSSTREALATDRDLPELARLGTFRSPDEFVDQLRKLGMKPRSEKIELNKLPLVTVTVDGKLQVRFISRRYCRDAPYHIP